VSVRVVDVLKKSRSRKTSDREWPYRGPVELVVEELEEVAAR